MRAIVIYESLTGNTRHASELIAAKLDAAGVETTVSPITSVDYAALSAADLVFIGSWTDGLLFIGQKPGRAGRMRSLLPAMRAKRCVVFCTFALDSGKTLEKLTAMAADRGAQVLGGMALHRRHLDEQTTELVLRTLDVVTT